MARRMAEALWWVMVRNEPYRYRKGGVASTGSEVIQLSENLVDPKTGEVWQLPFVGGAY